MPELAEVSEAGVAGLRLKRVWKRFGAVVAVKDVSFSAMPGEVHALLGENGAGKSTLMGIASGDVRPDSGVIEIGGVEIERLSSALAQRRGLAIVHQHPAVLPDLTVAENMILAVPRHLRRGDGRSLDWVMSQLERVGCSVHPKTRMTDVGVAQRHLIELAKALAVEPKVLVLDEPTAPLTADLVQLLFDKIRAAAARGAAIVYISHRLQEVRQIADRVTVMRDGEVRGSALVDEMSDDEMLRLIVGRTVTSVFPAKGAGVKEGTRLVVKDLSGRNFHNVSMVARGGEIVGIAGITGNGQSEFLRSLAGLAGAWGEATLGNKSLRLGHPESAYKAGITFLSSERQSEGLFMRLSVRENAALSALPRFARFGVIRRSEERAAVDRQRDSLAIRTPSIDANVGSLSGGNQQKVILARTLLANASLVLAEEPTAGVDVGARAEIYGILREIADRGTPVVIVSSDMLELEGLCDRVIVFSRGQNVGELAGDEVSEEQIGRTMITATTHRKDEGERKGGADAHSSWRWRLRQFAAGDYAPSVVLVLLILALGAYATGHNVRFVSAFNIEKMLLLSAALAFVGYGQACAIFTGGIDVSVGPLVGLVVVISSFFFNDGSTASIMIAGLLAMFAAGAVAGFVNGSLVRFGNFTSVAATLGVFIIIQGISVLLRPAPGGPISTDVIDAIQYQIEGVPIAFVVALLLGIGLEIALRYTRWGLSLRGVGSHEQSASRIGVATNWVVVGAFVACSVLTALGGVMVMAQLGIGDANQGVAYTLSSIAAVVLGGASLFGGRGAFIGVLFGALLIQVINSTTVFLSLSGAWQYWFIGGITLGAVAIYSQARRPQA
jgi:ABC-type sugar transport system ATPase subunit/ribose/xylose/arabinose/galactoside ABC-type transport system permease subunit